MPVTGLETAGRDLGRRSMMAMKDPTSGGLGGLPPEAFVALTERVRLAEDRLQSAPTKAELSRAVSRAVILGGAIGAVVGATLGVVIGRLIG